MSGYLPPVRYSPSDVKHMERKWWETRFNPRRLSGRDAGRSAVGSHVGGLHTSHIWQNAVLCSSAVHKPCFTVISHQCNTRSKSLWLSRRGPELSRLVSSFHSSSYEISVREWLVIAPRSRANKNETLQLIHFCFIFVFSPLPWDFSLVLWRGVAVIDVTEYYNILHYTDLSVRTCWQIFIQLLRENKNWTWAQTHTKMQSLQIFTFIHILPISLA